MAGTKISDLPSASTLTGAELVPVVQSDVTKKTTISDILTSAGAGTVTSVNVSGGTTGLTATGGPITTSGTITLSGTLDVDNGGTGATTAANARTNLGAAASGTNADITSMTGVTGGISTPDFIQFDTGGSTTAVAKEYWDDNSGGLSYGMKGGNVTQNTGQQTYQRVYNTTGATIAKGSVVYVTGSSGTRITVAKAQATVDATSATVLGVTAENISNNSEGFVLTQGEITNISTTGISDGALLWLSPSVAGAFTSTKPTAPDHLVLVGYCIKGGSGGAGIIYVKMENGYELGELHDVYVSSPTNGQTLIYNETNDRWENHNLTAGSGITITNGAGSITIASSAGGGSVTSVNASGGTTGMSFSGGPITTSGTLTLAGTLDVDNGGTGQTSYTNGQLLIGNSTGNTLTKSTLTAGSGITITNGAGSITIAASGAGTGDVIGPASATNNAVARFDGTTGKLIKDTSDFTIDASNRVGIGGVATNTKVNITGVLPEVSGYCYSLANRGTVPSTTSNLPVGVLSELNTQASGTTWTLGTYYHFAAANGTAGANAVVNGQVGFHSPDLTIGQSAIGYNSSVSIGTNKWNIYAGGDAQNFFRGKVGIGVGNTTPGSELDVKGTIRLSGSTSGYVGLAPAAAAGSTTYTLPNADGTNGQVLKTDGTGTLSWTSVGGTGTVTSIDVSGGTTGLTTSGGPVTGSGTITLAGTLDVDNGGTGQTSYTDGQLLIGNSSGNTLTKATLTAGTGISITNGNGSITVTATNAGTVTSVGQTFTGGLISVSGSPITSFGTLALSVAGTSGGIPYFSSGTTWASSGALAANALMVGGGAGAAPSTVTTGTGVVTALGVNTGSAGAFVVNGGALGTPSSGTLTNATGLPVSSGISGLGTGVATALAVNTGTAGAFVVNGGALGTPSSGTLTNATGLPISTGVSGLGTGVATFLATPSSANLASAVTDETGSGSLVFATSPTLVTPILGTPTSGNLSNCTADGTNSVGYRNIPQSGSDKTTSYTLATTDVGKFIGVGTGGSITVPNSTFAAGDVVSIFNNTTGNVTLTTSTTSAYIAGTNSSKASMTLATRGVATILFISGTVCVVSGNVT